MTRPSEEGSAHGCSTPQGMPPSLSTPAHSFPFQPFREPTAQVPCMPLMPRAPQASGLIVGRRAVHAAGLGGTIWYSSRAPKLSSGLPLRMSKKEHPPAAYMDTNAEHQCAFSCPCFLILSFHPHGTNCVLVLLHEQVGVRPSPQKMGWGPDPPPLQARGGGTGISLEPKNFAQENLFFLIPFCRFVEKATLQHDF